MCINDRKSPAKKRSNIKIRDHLQTGSVPAGLKRLRQLCGHKPANRLTNVQNCSKEAVKTSFRRAIIHFNGREMVAAKQTRKQSKQPPTTSPHDHDNVETGPHPERFTAP